MELSIQTLLSSDKTSVVSKLAAALPDMEQLQQAKKTIIDLTAPTSINSLQVLNPLVMADQEKALQTIQALLSTIRSLKQEIQPAEAPACPYQQTLIEFLGPDFICPTIHDLAFPVNFSTTEAVSSITEIGKCHHEHMMNHLQAMSAEAADMGFPGITSQNLGNAFAVLSTTANGEEYVIDRVKTAKHLEFAEIVRNIPTDYIIANPSLVAQKLIARYIEIN